VIRQEWLPNQFDPIVAASDPCSANLFTNFTFPLRCRDICQMLHMTHLDLEASYRGFQRDRDFQYGRPDTVTESGTTYNGHVANFRDNQKKLANLGESWKSVCGPPNGNAAVGVVVSRFFLFGNVDPPVPDWAVRIARVNGWDPVATPAWALFLAAVAAGVILVEFDGAGTVP
jgi:hypothetical protein